MKKDREIVRAGGCRYEHYVELVKGRPVAVYTRDGKPISEEEYHAELAAACAAIPAVKGGTPGASLGCWTRPLESDALAVHPDQIAEAREDAARAGIPTDFTPDGRPMFTSRGHRARYCKHYGFFDRDGGYSDSQRG